MDPAMDTILAMIPGVACGENLLFGIDDDGESWISIMISTLWCTTSAVISFQHPLIIRYGSDRSITMEVFIRSDQSRSSDQIEKLVQCQLASDIVPDHAWAMPNSVHDPIFTSHDAMAAILKAADAIGWERVKYLSDDGKTIEFTVVDGCHREHAIRFAYNDQLKLRYTVTLPGGFTVSVDKDAVMDITKIYELFITAIDKYEMFWSDMDELDSRAYVLEPSKPNYADTYRLVYLKSQVSLHIDVNPMSPRTLPKLALIGPSMRTKTYQCLIDEKSSNWLSSLEYRQSGYLHVFDFRDNQYSVSDNLIQMFGLFPRPGEASQQSLKRQYPEENEKDDDEPAVCAICFGLEEPPQEMCKKCQRFYHRTCLLEAMKRDWIRFKMFGANACACPQCGQILSLKKY